MTQEEFKLALEAAYLAGFNASGEGYNAEFPFDDRDEKPSDDRIWRVDRDNYIKEALAQLDSVQAKPEQEPVAWMRSEGTGSPIVTEELCQKHPEYRLFFTVPLYTTPPQRTWVGLTWEEIDECFKITPDQYLPAQIYRRIEAKLKEKNT